MTPLPSSPEGEGEPKTLETLKVSPRGDLVGGAPLATREGQGMSPPLEGVIIKNTGSWYVVRTDDDRLFSCKVRGNFRLRGLRTTNPVAVGDRVVIRSDGVKSDGTMEQHSSLGTQNSSLGTQNYDGVGLITDILDRRNYIIRRASNLSKQSHILAANVDQVLLLVTIAHPAVSTTFIDRFLAVAEAYRVPVILLFNKTDLYSEAENAQMQSLITLYRSLHYQCLPCSVLRGEGLDELKDMLRDRVTLLSGNSGVGKSTLLNYLIPGLDVRTEAISESHDSGQHTTTFSEMFRLPTGGDVIDTPGIKGFGTFDIEREELSHYFREIFQIGQECRFQDCTHTHEPGCAVRQALDEGCISPSRFASYLSMLDDKDEDRYRQGY